MSGPSIGHHGIYRPNEIDQMHDAIDAVCAELGIRPADLDRRERIAGSVMNEWARGRRTPLHLVRAGLDGAAREMP